MADTEQSRASDEDMKIREYLTEQSIIAYREHVIEECARVAKDFLNGIPTTNDLGDHVAAAIRALKDKP